tara:strand:- start:80 stop:880 length:801 start_codon:yes stop_codon:yes gene_type:complete
MIIIIGMPRSGTTLVANILGQSKLVKVLIEPHILWKTANFNFFNDDEFHISKKIINRIRSRFYKYADGKILVEKSPINCIRAKLVYKTFPKAKIVFLERNKIDCINSNYLRSCKKDSFKFSIIFKKYFSKFNDTGLEYSSKTMPIVHQLYFSDLFYFFIYLFKSFFYRNFLGILPFGPKIKGFYKIINDNGLKFYHSIVYEKSIQNKLFLKKKYKENFCSFSFENLYNDNEIKKLYDFCGLSINENDLQKILKNFNRNRFFKNQTI